MNDTKKAEEIKISKLYRRKIIYRNVFTLGIC